MDTGNIQEPFRKQKDVLKAFSRALQREAHVLTQHPVLLWQQLHNRLQWEGEEVRQVLTPELTKRSASGVRLWLRLEMPGNESPFLVRTLQGHNYGVSRCMFSPDGEWIASIDPDELFTIWQVSSGTQIWACERRKDNDEYVSCGFLEGGLRVYAASKRMKVYIWETASGQPVRTLEFPKVPFGLNTGTFAPDGSFFVSAGEDRTVRVWDTASASLLITLEGHSQGVFHCSLSPAGDRIASTGRDQTIRIWDVSTGRTLQVLRGHTDPVYSCRFSPDGTRLVSASKDTTLRLWDTKSGQLLRCLEGHTEGVETGSFSPDGLYIVSSGIDRSVRLWDAESGCCLAILNGHTDWVTACDFSPDENWIVSGSRDRTLKLWKPDIHAGQAQPDGYRASSPADGRAAFTPVERNPVKQERISVIDPVLLGASGQSDWVYDCSFSPDGKRLAVTGADGKVSLLSLDGSGSWKTISETNGKVHACRFSPDGRRIIIANPDNALQVFDVKDMAAVCTLEGYTLGMNSYDFSPDGCRVVSGCTDRKIRIWNAVDGRLLQTLEGHRAEVYQCRFSPDGNIFVSASHDHTLGLWDASSAEQLNSLDGFTIFLESCAFSPDGRWIAGGGAFSLQVWDVHTGERVSQQQFNLQRVMACSFLPDASSLLTVSDDRTLWVSDPENGIARGWLPLPGMVTAMAVHPHLPYLVCGDDTGALYGIVLMAYGQGVLIVTASVKNGGLFVTCPLCQYQQLLRADQPGGEMTCPQVSCGTRLKLNPFIIRNE